MLSITGNETIITIWLKLHKLINSIHALHIYGKYYPIHSTVNKPINLERTKNDKENLFTRIAF